MGSRIIPVQSLTLALIKRKKMYVLITDKKIQTDTCEIAIPGSLLSVSFLSVKS